VLTDLSLISNLDYVVSGRSHEYDDAYNIEKNVIKCCEVGLV